MKDPTREELIVSAESLRNLIGNNDGFECDLEVAIYWFSNDWHGGQWSNLYSVLSTSEYRPGRMETGIGDPDNESAEIIYNHLFETFKEDGDVYEKEETE